MSFTTGVLIGEIYLPIERLVAYYGRNLAGVHLPFNFTLLNALECARDLDPDPRIRVGAARGRLAELGAGQSRPAPHRQPGRARPGAHRRHASADAAGHADASTTATRSA